MTNSTNQTTDQLITQILSDAPGSDIEYLRRRLVMMSDKPTQTQVDALIRRAYKAATMCITKDDAIIRELAATITVLQAERDAAVARAEAAEGLPKPCDGKEQYAFEAWAKENHYDMNEHPLHYIFIDPKTNAARMGWNACIKYMLLGTALSTDTKGK